MLSVVLLAGCSQPPAKAPSPGYVDAVAAIRALGAQFQSTVHVHPLRDPAVDGLLDQAHKFEAQRQPAQALVEVGKALTIAPHAPDVLQYAAELNVETGDWKQAAALAQQSYDVGPKVGGLCARNLETLARSLTVDGDAVGAVAARAKIPACRVTAVPRF
ncbi:MAG: tetratricopeptide repeat protein [Rudaea sp.]